MDSPTSDTAPAGITRAANVLHLVPPDAARLARLVLPTLTAAAGAAASGLRTLVLTDDDDTAVEVARCASREVGGGMAPIVALTAGARARRVLAAQLPGAVAIPVTVAAALLGKSALPCANVRHVLLAMPAVPSDPAVQEAINAVMAELPKNASRTLVAARETPDVEALVERHFFKARRVREEAMPALTAYKGQIQVVATAPGSRWDTLRRLLDEIDPPAAVILTPDASAHADAQRELAALGYSAAGPVLASRGDVAHGTSMVVLTGVPDAAMLRTAAAAAPVHLIVLCAPREIREVRAIAGPIPVRVVALDAALARAASREAATRGRLREILVSGEFGRELGTLAPLLDEFDGSEVAAAALVMAAEAARASAQRATASAPPPPPATPREPRREPGRETGRRDAPRPERGHARPGKPTGRPPSGDRPRR